MSSAATASSNTMMSTVSSSQKSATMGKKEKNQNIQVVVRCRYMKFEWLKISKPLEQLEITLVTEYVFFWKSVNIMLHMYKPFNSFLLIQFGSIFLLLVDSIELEVCVLEIVGHVFTTFSLFFFQRLHCVLQQKCAFWWQLCLFCNTLLCFFNRPLNSSEKKAGAYSIVDMCPEKREVSIKERGLPTAPVKTFTYDRVFHGSSKQIEIYKTVVGPILDEVLMGYNCTIFA
jgi:hypothetical protein